MMIKKLKTASLTMMMFALMGTNIYANEKGLVTASSLNIRKGPSTSHTKITSVKKGTTLDIIKEENGWSKVKLSNNQEGWASSQYIDDVVENESLYNEVEIKKSGVVKANSLNVRKGPSTSHTKISSLKGGTKVYIVSESNGWYKVELQDNSFGWVSGDYISLSTQSVESNTTDNVVIVEATAYTGYTVTSTGDKPRWGTIAVDPNVIPYGTKVYIPEFDEVFIANNTGSAIKGNKIDIYMDSEEACKNWGRRSIEIQILD